MLEYDELEKYVHSQKTSSHDRTNAFFQGTEEIHKFSETVIIPVLKTQILPDDREKAIIGTYFRMHMCLASMVKLNEQQYLQQVVSSARTIFELFIDLKILNNDRSDESINKFHAFPQIAKYSSAKKLINFIHTNPDRVVIESKHRQKYLDDPANSTDKIDSIITKYWGFTRRGTQKKPEDISHWTGLDLRSRTRNLGIEYEQIYVEIYDWQSWYIHSGSSSYVGLNKETYEAVFGYSHALVQKLFLKAIIICGEEIHLNKIDSLKDSLNNIVKQLELFPGMVMLEKDIDNLNKLKTSDK